MRRLEIGEGVRRHQDRDSDERRRPQAHAREARFQAGPPGELRTSNGSRGPLCDRAPGDAKVLMISWAGPPTQVGTPAPMDGWPHAGDGASRVRQMSSQERGTSAAGAGRDPDANGRRSTGKMARGRLSYGRLALRSTAFRGVGGSVAVDFCLHGWAFSVSLCLRGGRRFYTGTGQLNRPGARPRLLISSPLDDKML